MCQLQYIDELGEENSWFNETRQFLIRKYRWYKKRFFQAFHKTKNSSNVSQLYQAEFQPGDKVRVRPEVEIQSILNQFRKTKGCTFQLGMYPHCGKEYKVYKKVEYFFDEARQKICKCNGIYLLEGAYCNGKTAYLTPCDRNCFFFWHSSWLEKV